jgi:hypothetical protein
MNVVKLRDNGVPSLLVVVQLSLCVLNQWVDNVTYIAIDVPREGATNNANLVLPPVRRDVGWPPSPPDR